MIDKQAATKIIRETFEKPFDKGRFAYFAKNLLNKIDESKVLHLQGAYIPESFREFVKTYERLGTYTDPEGQKLDILIVYLQKETSLERARTAQRNFVARYLKERGEKEAGLVAFISPEPGDWRFSFVKMEYRLEETPQGKVKAKEELTPARRYSFLVGENESSHTAQKRLLPILQEDKNNPSLSILEEAFSIEVVTREFFERYRGLYINLKEYIDRFIEGEPSQKIRKEFEAKGIDTVVFCKKLLGQIVFLYFLQKKGWLGCKEKWNDGDKKFLRNLFIECQRNNRNFFNDYLEYLFYDALNNEHRGSADPSIYPRFGCKIPFLNGGLFNNDYDWQATDIKIGNELFSNKKGDNDEGSGVLDLFDLYNFTVKEDEPLEKEVAVDPEMLGKVFENLLEVKDRKSKGTYYTPREIVHYMCQESLINYLNAAVNTGEVPLRQAGTPQGRLLGERWSAQMSLSATGYQTVVPRQDIEDFVRKGELAIEHDTRVETLGRETKTYSYRISESIRSNARIIDDKLVAIRVCDPAVGSGAFLVGMMHEIVKCRKVLTTYLSNNKEGRSVYDFKRHAIQSCLYGVDIDPGAVEIAKLRLWLSLVVDEEDIRQIKPLPNLDYKIVCGNSLLGVTKDVLNWPLFEELEKLKPLYFNETNTKKKQEFRNQIDKLIKKLTNNKELFDFEVYFSEVFHEKGGFDVAIANPPYVSFGLRNNKNAAKEWANVVRKLYPGSAEYKISLYALFIDLALKIARKGGVICYITPDSFLLGRYFSKLRRTLLDNTSVNRFVMFERDFWKSGVVGRPTISLYQKGMDGQMTTVVLAEDEKALSSNNILEYTYPQEYFKNVPFNRFRLFFSPIAKKFVETLESGSKPLNSVAHITTGVRSKTKQDEVVSITCTGPKWKKGIVSGSQVHQYCVEWKGHYLNIDGNLLFAGGWNQSIIEKPKIMIRQTGDSIIAGIDLDNLYHLNNVHSLHLISPNVSLSYMCALLNSRLMNRYYHLISLEYKRTMAQTDIETLELLPYREPDAETLRRIDSLFPGISDTDSRNEVERILEHLYGLDNELINYLAGEEFYPRD